MWGSSFLYLCIFSYTQPKKWEGVMCFCDRLSPEKFLKKQLKMLLLLIEIDAFSIFSLLNLKLFLLHIACLVIRPHFPISPARYFCWLFEEEANVPWVMPLLHSSDLRLWTVPLHVRWGVTQRFHQSCQFFCSCTSTSSFARQCCFLFRVLIWFLFSRQLLIGLLF